MPKQILERFAVSRLSILNEQGKVDPSLDPHLDPDLLKKIFQHLCLTRRFDEKAVRAQRQGRLGTFAASTGQEAVAIGSAAALKESDWIIPSFREQGTYLWRRVPAKTLFLFYMGSELGNVFPKEKHILPMAVPCASQTLHAVGLAKAAQLKGEPAVMVTYLGDGATSEGDFHEALNLASVLQAPVIFICQNNRWAISTPPQKQYRCESLAERALGYSIPGIQVDGNDVLAVYRATQDALTRARQGQGPSFLECETYRLAPHTTNDNPELYRENSEVNFWKKRDPLVRFEKYLLSRQLLKPGEKEKMLDWIDHQLKGQLELAELECSQNNPFQILDHVFHDIPEYLKQERAELTKNLRPSSNEPIQEERSQ